MEITAELLKDLMAVFEKYIAVIEDEELVEEPIEEPTEEEPVEEPVEEPTEEPTEESVEEPVEELPENVGIVEDELNEEPIPIEELDPEPELAPIGTPIEQEATESLLPIDVLVDEILEGKWGSGTTRKEKIEKAGYNYNDVQKRVNEILQVVQEVLDGKWGSGDERKKKLEKAGYSYDTVQRQINRQLSVDTHDQVINKMNTWAKKIAADNRYHYNKWEQSNTQSHKCPICSKLDYDKDKKHFGWNCIGFGAAVWHHGGGLGNTCNCSWVSGPGGTGEKLLEASSDAEALKLAKKYTGLSDIKIIRNKNGIPKSQWKAGDICLRYVGNEFNHVFYYMGNGKIADSTGSSGNVANDKQIGVRSYDNYSAKVIIRWIGGTKATTTPVTTPTTTKKAYSGTLPTTKLVKTNAEVINDAVKWATWIAGDNRFHYGHGTHSHHNGCYFCGTQGAKKDMLMPKYTYCCNPFIGAAWAHGGCIPAALKQCQNGKSWSFDKGKGYDSLAIFTNLGHPAKSKLKKGDVLCKDGHIAMYIGDGKLVEAAMSDDNKKNSSKWNNSIHVASLTDSRYKGFQRVHRYNGSVNTTMYIRHGEVSKRVSQWQAFLDWWYDGKVGSADGIYGDNTLKWTKKFQEEQIGKGQGDGIIGPATLEAAKKCKK